MAHHRVQQWLTFSKLWWIYDAKWQSPFLSAKVIVQYLEGKHKPIYSHISEVGDHVVVLNAQHIAMEGELWRTFRINHHTGYPKGFTQTRAFDVHNKDPSKLLRKIIYSNMKNTLRRRPVMEKLHIFPDENVPEDILRNITGQIKQVMPLPRKLEDFSQDEIKRFPRLFELPDEYAIKKIEEN